MNKLIRDDVLVRRIAAKNFKSSGIVVYPHYKTNLNLVFRIQMYFQTWFYLKIQKGLDLNFKKGLLLDKTLETVNYLSRKSVQKRPWAYKQRCSETLYNFIKECHENKMKFPLSFSREKYTKAKLLYMTKFSTSMHEKYNENTYYQAGILLSNELNHMKYVVLEKRDDDKSRVNTWQIAHLD